MRKKILLLTVAVLFSTVNSFAESTPAWWGKIALRNANYSSAFSSFKEGADEGMYPDCYSALSIMYAMGLGTSKNPQQAFKYLNLCLNYDYGDGEEIVSASEHAFWASFYTGKPIALFEFEGASNIGLDGWNLFVSVPKYYQFVKSSNYTCKAWGQSANMKKAAEHLKQSRGDIMYSDKYPKDVLAIDGNADLFLQYAEKTNDAELKSLLAELLGDEVFEKSDSVKYAKTVKDAEHIKKYIAEAGSKKWRYIARIEYIKICAPKIFKNGIYNQQIDDSVRSMINCEEKVNSLSDRIDYEQAKNKAENIYKQELEKGFYTTFFSYVAKQDWEQATALQCKFNEYALAKNAIDFKNAYDDVKKKIAAGTINKKSLSAFTNIIENGQITYAVDQKKMAKYGFNRKETYLNGIKNEVLSACDSMVLAKSANWNVNTSIDEMCNLIAMASNAENKAKVQDKFDQIAIEKATAWNFGTKINEMDELVRSVSSDASKAKVSQEYNQVALEKAATWTVDHSATLMDAVVEMNYLDEETKAKVQEAYQKNALDRMKAAGKSKKDFEKVKTTLESVKSMKHVNAVTQMRADEIYEKAEAKTRPFFLVGVEGGVGLTGDMQTLAPAGGASIILGRSSQRLNLYVGGQYIAENGLFLASITEPEPFAAKEEIVAAKFKKIEVPAELRFNYLVDNYYCSYIGVGAVYNYVLGGDVYYLEEGSDKVSLLTFTDGLNPNYLAARVSWGLRLKGVDLGLYVNYNLTSPYNSNAVTDDLSVFEGTYFDTQMKKSKITTGLRLGIYF